MSIIRIILLLIICALSVCLIYKYCFESNKDIKTKAEYLVMVEKSYNENKPEWPPHPDRLEIKEDNSLIWFFEDWKYVSENLAGSKTDKIEDEIYKIFPLVYHPTNLQKYGIIGFSSLLRFQYAIVPSCIKYGVINDFNIENMRLEYADKKLCNFYPKSKVENISYLYNIEPFRSVVKCFIYKDIGSPRSVYLNSYVQLSRYITDNSLGWLKLDYILLDYDMSKAFVCINPWEDEDGDEIYIFLSKIGREWKIDSIQDNTGNKFE